MKQIFAGFLLVTLAVFGLTGCSSMKLGGVSVTVLDIKPATPSAKGMQANVTLNFTNENIISIGITKATHKLYLNDTLVGKSIGENAIGLLQATTANQTVIFQIEKPELLRNLALTAKTQPASYRLDSHMEVVVGEDQMNMDTKYSGSLDLRSLADSK